VWSQYLNITGRRTNGNSLPWRYRALPLRIASRGKNWKRVWISVVLNALNLLWRLNGIKQGYCFSSVKYELLCFKPTKIGLMNKRPTWIYKVLFQPELWGVDSKEVSLESCYDAPIKNIVSIVIPGMTIADIKSQYSWVLHYINVLVCAYVYGT